jgi:hypothetical protein
MASSSSKGAIVEMLPAQWKYSSNFWPLPASWNGWRIGAVRC